MNKSPSACVFKAEMLEIFTDDKLFPKSFPLDEELLLEKVFHFYLFIYFISKHFF